MLRIPPTVVDVPGYQLQRPPLPLIYTPRSCGGAAPSCHSLLCMHKRELRRASRNVSYKAALCGRCECALCLACARPRNLWKAPSGQTLETVTTRTDPPFTFAYNPADADMKRMRDGGRAGGRCCDGRLFTPPVPCEQAGAARARAGPDARLA
mmetsp:Transcript_35754/g.119512  ORF Transcript_35754/g.119512 Transcript_35754/m.119512 type:complete len:153 (+) Transcript_35754:29-487(+)